jgi:hypothetical protein
MLSSTAYFTINAAAAGDREQMCPTAISNYGWLADQMCTALTFPAGIQ